MKKRGFTLPELLISVAIIAVVAVIAAPMLENIKPDKYKIKVVNYYGTITDAVNTLLDNKGVYYTTYDNNGNATCIGLACTGQPAVAPYDSADYSGANKFRNLMFALLNVDNIDMVDTNGTQFTITPLASGNYWITIDVDSNNNANCTYSTSPRACPKPDQFKFLVTKTGEVSPRDAMTYAYIKNASSKDKKADIELASSKENDFITLNINDQN